MFAAHEDEPDLRPVAVGDDDAEAPLEQVRDVADGVDDRGVLVGHALVMRILYERVAADGDDEGFHGAKPVRAYIVSHQPGRPSIFEPVPCNKCAAIGKT